MDWSEVVLGDYIDVLTDYHANGAYEKLKANVTLKHEKDYAVMIRTLNFERGDFEKGLIYVNKVEYDFLAKSKVYSGDILMNKIADPGTVYLMPDLGAPVSLAMNLFLIRFKKSVNQHFMYYLMHFYEPYIKLYTNGAATATITKDTVRKLKFKIPRLDIQEKIVAIISAYDNLVENNLQQIKILEETRMVTYEEWFHRMKFPGHENTLIDKKTKLPKGWQRVPLPEVIDFKEGPGLRNWQYRDKGIPFLNIRVIKGDEVDLSKVKYLDPKEVSDKYKHFLLEEDDHVISTSGTLGRLVTIRKCHLPICLNTSLIRMRQKTDLMGKWQIKHMLLGQMFQGILDVYANGSAQVNFGPTHLKQIKLIVPTSKIAAAYEEIAIPIEENIKILKDQILLLKEARDILLPRIMTGMIDIDKLKIPEILLKDVSQKEQGANAA